MRAARRARGTWLESHFRWQIRTFWYAWLWIIVVSIVAMPLLLVVVGFLIGLLGLALSGPVGDLSRRARLALAARRASDAAADRMERNCMKESQPKLLIA